MSLANVTLFEFLQRANEPSTNLLPLVHTAETADLIDIVNSRELRPSPCQFFGNEKYLYMFIGRPSYRIKDADFPEVWQLPTVFVLKNEGVEPDRIHPFDTGAFQSRKFPSYMSAMSLSDYLLPSTEVIGKYIGTFYGSLDRYYLRRAVSQEEFVEKYNLLLRHKAVTGLSRLLTEKTTASLDDRCATVELQVSHTMDITSGNLMAIILPSEVLRDRELEKAIKLFGCDILKYDQQSLSVREYYAQIYDLCMKFYRKKKFI